MFENNAINRHNLVCNVFFKRIKKNLNIVLIYLYYIKSVSA